MNNEQLRGWYKKFVFRFIQRWCSRCSTLQTTNYKLQRTNNQQPTTNN